MNHSPPPPPVAARRRRWPWLALAVVLAAALALLAAGAWLWHSGSAQARLLRAIPGLEVEGLQGRATGGAFAIERLRWRGAGLAVEVDGLHWQDLAWRWRPHDGAWIGLTLDRPQARALRVTRPGPAPDAEPLRLPASLRLPLALSARGLALGPVQLDGTELFGALGADVALGADAGARHRIDGLQLSRGSLRLTGDLALGSDGALPLDARLALATPTGQPTSWRADVQIRGPLRRLDVEADLQTEAGATLEARAAVTPLAAWPLAALALQARALDLSALAAGMPQTALSGSAELGDVAEGAPLRLNLALDNAASGPWDAGRLPVRRAHGVLQGRPDQPDRLAFDGWMIELGSKGNDGQVAASGRWQGSSLELALRLQGVQAARLDTRAPPAAVDGTLALTVAGLALPGSAGDAGTQALQGRVRVALHGKVPPPTPPLTLGGDIAFALPGQGAMALNLRGLEASAGTAKTKAALDARRTATGTWTLKSDGSLEQVDLATWWRAAGASNLNGRWQAELQLPESAPGSLLESLRGAARVVLDDSRFSGVPLSGTLELDAGAQGLAVDAQFAAAGNRVRLAGGRAATRRDGPEWRVELQAPALQALSPLLQRVPGATDWLPASGALRANATIGGSWPALRSEGRLQIDALRLPQGRLDAGSARWSVAGTTPDASIEVDAELSGLAQGVQRIDRLRARVGGSLQAHRLELEAESPLRPPAWLEPAAPADAGGTAAPGSALRVEVDGRWLPAVAASPLGAGEWRGRLAPRRAAARDPGAAPWLAAGDVGATVRLDAASRPVEARLEPGRVEAFGAALAWQQATWQAPERAGGAPRIALDARLEPLPVAPILARLQPGLGWSGDLRIAGNARVRGGARLDADLVIERQGGDLGLNLGDSPHELGLTALRLDLGVHEGRWQLQQALAGRLIGTLDGRQTLLAGADAPWPSAQAALQGEVALRVPDAGIYAPWLPPGWRLAGALGASLTLGGVLEAPSVSGTLFGDRLAVRNAFEGVNLGDGSLRVRLDGRHAAVERVHFAGAGGGTLDVHGTVDFDDAPQADLEFALARFRALDRVDRRVALSGGGTIGLRAGRLTLRGRLGVDEGLIDVTADDAPSLGADVLVVGRTDAQGRPLPEPVQAEAAPPAALAGADIDLALSLGEALRVRGRGLDTLLRGQLQIGTTAAGKLSVHGAINTARGSYTAYGQNLAIERGTISFSGDAANPRLDVLALRADIDNRVGVIVSGPAADPRVRLYSDPDLPEIDQLTWLLTGEEPQGQGRNETALLQRAALALLAGDRGASDEGFLQQLGIDQLGVARSAGGETVVTVGKRLSRRLSILYEKGLSAAGGTWSLLYRIAGRTTLRARTGVENAVEVIWNWRWE